MVDYVHAGMERKFNFTDGGYCGPVLGRLRSRVRRPLNNEGEKAFKGGARPLERRGTTFINQRKGTPGSGKSGKCVFTLGKTQGLCDTATNRQYSHDGVCQQNGRKVSSPPGDCGKDAGTVRKFTGYGGGGALTWCKEQAGRCVVKNAKGQDRLAAPSSSIQFFGQNVGPSHSGFLRNKVQHSVTEVRSMGSRRHSYVHRWFGPSASEGERIRKPPFLNDWSGVAENSFYSKGSYDHRTSMAGSILVAPTAQIIGGRPNTTSSGQQLVPTFGGKGDTVYSSTAALDSTRLQDLWEVYRKKKVSKEVAQLITGRWAASTGKNYDTVWNYWKQFCVDEKCSPVYPYQFQVLDFLNKEFKRRNTASAVNQAISALASVLNVSMGDGFMLSADVLAYRKAVNIKCPTGPALVDIWNIAIIFTYMRKEKEVKLLSLAELQERCIILLRVDLFSRSSDLTRLFREQIVFTKTVARYVSLNLRNGALRGSSR